MSLTHRPDIPPPDSEDPVYPGVLVNIQNWEDEGRLRQTVLSVGTLGNVRAKLNYAMLDGPGAGLWVRKVTVDGFEGTWKPWGRGGGAGYFCAKRFPP